MENLETKTFGRWTVLNFAGYERPNDYWNCRCSCGVTRRVSGKSLRFGKSKSCGCFKREVLSNSPNATTHGLSRHPLFKIWSGMRQRCLDKMARSYANYGGRGISIDDRWLKFQNFYDDMIKTWNTGLTLERIDNDGNYTSSNCCWIPRSSQAGNRRTSVRVEIHGETMCLAEAVRRYAVVGWKTVRYRMKLGWPILDCLTKPSNRTKTL